MIVTHPVGSSMIAEVGYDEENLTLRVKFNKGGNVVYDYAGVTPEKHAELMNAKSIGRHFHKNIKGKYDVNKVELTNDHE